MPKAEKGSVKDIGKRIKARGLQKLKFYCQMCQKQCRDANGFKCHIQSESHLRQMKIFSSNAGGIMDKYSRDFERFFLSCLRMRHGTKKVNANNVYQEVISDKEHIHMNATHWTTLTEFVHHLGKTGKCVVEENHTDGTGGWYVTYIERDAGIIARREAQQQREAADQKAEAALLERMKAQRIAAARALDRAGGTIRVEATSILDKEHNTTTPTIQLGLSSVKGATKTTTTKAKPVAAAAFGEDDDDDDENDAQETTKRKTASNVERLMAETSKRQPENRETATAVVRNDADTKKRKLEDDKHPRDADTKKSHSKEKKQKQDDYEEEGWLYRDILVRVVSKKLAGGKYFRKKAVVDKVLEDGYSAEVEILAEGESGDGDLLLLDQKDLETIIPKIGANGKPKKVRILKGDYRGKKATVDYLDKTKYRADLILYAKGESHHGKLLRKIAYEDFSQIA